MTHQDNLVQFLALCRTPKNQTMCLGVLSQHFLNSDKLGPLYWGACFSLFSTAFWVEKPFPDTQSKPPPAQLHAFSSNPVPGHESKDIGTCASASLCEDIEDEDEVSLQSLPG